MSNTTGSIHVTLTDPPSCAFPNGNFDHAYVSIRAVQAHTSASATDSTGGWQELAPQLNTQPMQLDTNGNPLKAIGGTTTVPQNLNFSGCS
jgi:hypothetical protein